MTLPCRLPALAAVLFCVAASTTWAQDDAPDASNGARVPEGPNWSSDRVASVGDLLEGSWRSTDPLTVLDLPSTDEDESTQRVHAVMHLARVFGRYTQDLLYVELAREDALDQPYHQGLMQLIEFGDSIVLRKLDVASQGDGLDAYAGFWAAPEVFPRFDRDRLIPVFDIELTESDDGYSGTSPHPYPTMVGSAVQATSRIELRPGHLVIEDHGLDAQGEQVWGERAAFEPYDPPVEVRRHPQGLVVVEYPASPDARGAEDQDYVQWAYRMWLYDNARSIGSSDFFGSTVYTQHPTGRGSIRALAVAAEDPHEGDAYRIFAPASFAFRDRGAEQRLVPPNASITAYFRVLRIQSPDEAAATPDGQQPNQGPQPREGGGG